MSSVVKTQCTEFIFQKIINFIFLHNFINEAFFFYIMSKWKSTSERTQYTARFLKLEENKETELTISDWDFTKQASGALFKCYVIKENGEEIDKIWTVWDYETSLVLKKKLGVKYVSGSKVLKVTMKKDDEEEIYFEIN